MIVAPVVDVLQGRVAVGSEVTVQGWVRTRRDSNAGFSFLAVYDGSCFNPLQAVINNNLPNYNDEVLHLTTGCSVEVTGIVKESPGQGQSFELEATAVNVVGWVEDPDTYPMAAKRHSVEYLREVAHLRPRTNLIGAVARVRHTLAQALHRFFDEQGYFWVSTPIITASDTEGAGEMFRVSTLDYNNLPRNDKGEVDFSEDFFGRESFLTVSGQLNGEAYATALSKVYTFGPTFRAENSNTSRHLAEFWMVEPEVAFASLDDVAGLAEQMLKFVFKAAWMSAAMTLSSSLNVSTKRLSTALKASLIQISLKLITLTQSRSLKPAVRNLKTPFTGGLICLLSMSAIWLSNISKHLWLLKTILRTLKLSICALTKMARQWQQWMYSPPVLVKSSVVHNVKSALIC